MLAAIYIPVWVVPTAAWVALLVGLVVHDSLERRRRRRSRELVRMIRRYTW